MEIIGFDAFAFIFFGIVLAFGWYMLFHNAPFTIQFITE
jgi:hypothetical protein